MEKTEPSKVFTAGHVRATVWKNEREGFIDYNVKLEKTYKDGEVWKSTNNYHHKELCDVMIVCQESIRFIRLKEKK